MRTILPLFIAVTLFFSANAQDRSYKTEENIQYVEKPVSDYQKAQCKLDVHYPTSGDVMPIVLWFHGGGLTGGQKEIPAFLKSKGFVVIGVGYRFSPQVKVEEIIQDAAKAVSYTLKNAEKYRGDKRKVFISGHSAGGYLALMLGLNKLYLQEEGIDANTLKGIIPFSGQAVTHFTARKEKGIDEKQATIDELSPIFWVRRDAAPIVLLTGDREKEMLGRYEENAYLKRMLLIVGHPDVKLMEFDGYGHDMVYPGLPVLVDEMHRLSKVK
ncbi:alpha/beta hydrolase [Sphingobacterium paludis]|uniref:Acetyl esterase/lipase n=1 Tax=Sphingobacterium paludis TaxID=1476465 RepID=A0A4R7CUP1_9SPHI|nr:alpha/beta hydrolase [Sphingobacterium paludis]TDS11860.1 acetyl esterase/lipase [Sphingobacterium paludis]